MNAFALAAALVLALGAPAAAQSVAIPGGDPTPAAAQSAILGYAVTDSVSEIQMCRLALQKSQTAAVRDFANRMISDHTQMAQQAATLARAAGDADSARLKAADDGQVRLAYLARYDGHEFDEHFLEIQVADHESDIAVFRNAIETMGASGSPIAAFVQATLPQLETHLRLAQAARDTVAENDHRT